MTVAPSSLRVQPLVEADLPALLRLYSQLQREDVPIAFERATAIWRTIAADGSYVYLGGFMDGALVSTCNATIVPNLTRGGRPYALIEGVITEEAWRRRGIGRAVLGALVERCWARDCYKADVGLDARGRAHVLRGDRLRPQRQARVRHPPSVSASTASCKRAAPVLRIGSGVSRLITTYGPLASS